MERDIKRVLYTHIEYPQNLLNMKKGIKSLSKISKIKSVFLNIFKKCFQKSTPPLFSLYFDTQLTLEKCEKKRENQFKG